MEGSSLLSIHEKQLIVEDAAFDTILSLLDNQTNRLQEMCRTKKCYVKLTGIEVNKGEELTYTNVDTKIKHEYDGLQQFHCDKCYSVFTTIRVLSAHKRSKHNPVKYSCDLCEYQAAHKSSVTIHQETKHEGVSYKCDHCEYVSLQKNNLNRHRQTNHENLRYFCNQCEYQATKGQFEEA